jgi:hypothetical protein
MSCRDALCLRTTAFVVCAIATKLASIKKLATRELDAAGVAALSIIPVATMVFRDAVPVETAERRKRARALICTLVDDRPTFGKLRH